MFDLPKEVHTYSFTGSNAKLLFSYCIQTAWMSLDKVTEKRANQ